MPRYIDANEIIKSEHQHYDYMSDEYYVLVRDIENAPTVDAEPVRHGHWINHFDDLFPEESTQECSVCHAEQMGTMLNDNYCPNCGAKINNDATESKPQFYYNYGAVKVVQSKDGRPYPVLLYHDVGERKEDDADA